MRAQQRTTPPIRRIALVVGDTPGHFYPALAVAETYRSHVAGVELAFFGPGGRSADLAARHACAYYPVSGGPLARAGIGDRAAALVRTLGGVGEARGVLRRLRVALALGFGGYASGAVLLAARSLGVRTAIHEANRIPGLANRLLSRVVDRVYLADAAAASHFAGQRVEVTGWPVRLAIAALADEPRRARSAAGRARVLVCAGSRGGGFFAGEMPAVAAGAVARGIAVEVRHQSGDADPEPVASAYSHGGVPALVTRFIDDMPAAYRWADVVVSRAGAGMLAEIAAAGLPSLLVPLADAADDHQAVNAAAFAGTGAARWIHERQWDRGAATARLSEILADSVAWSAMSGAARGLAMPQAAATVVDDCERLMGSSC